MRCASKKAIFPDTFSRLVYEDVRSHPVHVCKRQEEAVAATVQAFAKHPQAGQ